MKFNYQFSNLLGTAYRQGDVVFTSDGNRLLSPVGNRITVFDLANNTSRTLPSENGKNISILALTPDDSLLLSVDESGRSLLINFTNYSVLSHFNFGGAVRAVHFSPDGNLLAASKGRKVLVFQTPSRTKEFAPFRLLRTLGLHVDDIVSLDWSSDSQFLLTGSEDHTVRLQRPGHEFMPVILAAHRDTIVACMFGKTSEEIYTVARNGAVFVWRWHAKQSYRNNPETKFYLSSEGGIWRIAHRHFCHIQSTSLVEGLQHGEEEEALDSSVFVTCAAQMPKAGLLVVGLSNGVFRLCTMPEFSLVHSLSITQSRIDSIALNPSGEWIAFASSRLGQLLVWEWQSETYVLKQQGHYFDMRTTAYSPNGALMATGGDDCKVKVWNSRSGFCFCTFKDHTAPVTSVAFSKKGQVLLSASLDGTVRAYDLVRYRNFKVLAAPEPTQFSCVAIDASGEVVAAGSADSFGIFIWSLQTGRLLDILKGHEGPVSAVCFHPLTGKLASSSWDGSVRLWDIFGDLTAEQFKHSCEVLTCSFSHSGETICCATMDGSLNFWDVSEGRQISTIEGRRDIAGGRLIGQAMTSKNSAAGKHFTSVCFSADDSCVVAGGSTKYMCIYHVKHKVLIKRFQISRNLSLDGILDLLSTRNLTEGGPREQIEDDSRDDDHLPTLPGVKKGDLSSRRVPRAISCNELQFSPTGRSFCAATTEGLLIYSLDDDVLFDPFELDIEVTPENIKNTLTDKLYVKSLVMALQLNDADTFKEVFFAIPSSSIQQIVATLPWTYANRLVAAIAPLMEKSPHVEFLLLWTINIFHIHGAQFQARLDGVTPVVRQLQKCITNQYEDIAAICDENKYMLDFMCRQAPHSTTPSGSAMNRSGQSSQLPDVVNPFKAGSR